MDDLQENIFLFVHVGTDSLGQSSPVVEKVKLRVAEACCFPMKWLSECVSVFRGSVGR